jgi:hypothetical protein
VRSLEWQTVVNEKETEMSAPKEPFRVLSNEEFARLTTGERADYIRRAVEALDILRAQMSAEVFKSLKQIRERNNCYPSPKGKGTDELKP